MNSFLIVAVSADDEGSNADAVDASGTERFARSVAGMVGSVVFGPTEGMSGLCDEKGMGRLTTRHEDCFLYGWGSELL
jgi:hypothetical protein